MKIANMLTGLLMLICWSAAEAGNRGTAETYDDYTSRMLQVYKKEQAACGAEGRELDCLAAEYEMERVGNHLDALQGDGCGSDRDCGDASGNFWGM